MSIAQKEADETIYWLEIINEIESNNEKTASLIKEANELLKIIRSISINAKKNL
jgi:four helix bundle protein